MKKKTKALLQFIGLIILFFIFSLSVGLEILELLADKIIRAFNPDIISIAYMPKGLGPTLSVWPLGASIWAAVYYSRIKNVHKGWKILNKVVIVGLFVYCIHAFATYSYIPNDHTLTIRDGFFKETSYPITELRIQETVDEYKTRRSGKRIRMIIQVYHKDTLLFKDVSNFSVLNNTLVLDLIARGAQIEATDFTP